MSRWHALGIVVLEQAILRDGLSFREAFRASSKPAATEWWWSFGTTLELAALGIALAPGVGIVLLLAFRSLDLTYVNFITSAVYVAVWDRALKNYGPNLGFDWGGRLMAAWLDRETVSSGEASRDRRRGRSRGRSVGSSRGRCGAARR